MGQPAGEDGAWMPGPLGEAVRDVAARLDPLGLVPAVADAVRALAAHPAEVARIGLDWGVDAGFAGLVATARAVGAELPGPAELPERDRRFADPVWEENAWYWLCRQQYTLLAAGLGELSAAAELGPVERRKIDFLVDQLVSAAAPQNWPASSPAMVRRAVGTGGLSLVRGLRNALRDLREDGSPRQVPPGRFVVGEQLAATPGRVVFRNRLIELLQYDPQTPRVHEVPLLLSPPWINKYYVLDLAPGRSLAEWAIRHEQTVFAISYRDPDGSLRDLTLSDYLREGALAALDAVQEITGAARVNVAALCLGGTLATATAAWQAARGEERIGSLTLLNTLLDFARPGPLGVFADEATVERLQRLMRRDGYLPAAAMKRTFDSLRATDLFWDYVGSGWLEGTEPRPFDILAWNADSTRMPAAMQAEYLRTCYLRNELVEGRMELAGERLDLAAVHRPAYVVSAERDHIAPWGSVYSGVRRLGGPVRFVLAGSGHIAGVVNPPSATARFRTGTTAALPPGADEWRAAAVEHRSSWWEDWAPWLAERSGALRTPPPTGSAVHPDVGPAPGTYVRS